MGRKWLGRILAVLGLTLTAVYFTACQMMDHRRPNDSGLFRGRMETGTPWTISFLRAGDPDDPRLIYVHGTPGSAGAFRGYLSDPLPGFESISIDRPGFGLTKPRKPALTLREQAEVIAPFLVERDGKWPVLIGHSMGAPIICRVAADYPDRVGGLVLLSGSLDPELEDWKWYNQLADFAFVSHLIPRVLRNSNRELKPLWKELEELRPLLTRITCPVVIVHAPNDVLVPFENVAFMQAALPENTLRDVMVLEGKNHFIPWNAEDAVREAIRRAAGMDAGDTLFAGRGDD